MILEQEIDQHLSNLDLKLTVKKPLTFTNQKIKADVIEVIAELIIRYIDENDNYFSRQDLDIDFRDNSIKQNQENIDLVNNYIDTRL